MANADQEFGEVKAKLDLLMTLVTQGFAEQKAGHADHETRLRVIEIFLDRLASFGRFAVKSLIIATPLGTLLYTLH